MAEFSLPRNSKITKGRTYKPEGAANRAKAFKIYRYDPESGANPRYDTYTIDLDQCGPMPRLFNQVMNENRPDPTFAPCREGIAGCREHGRANG